MTWPSFASACPLATIGSTRARKRSFCPLFRRSFGRIESTSAKLTAEKNHGQRRRSICKKSSRQTLLSCNCKDSKKPTIPRKTRRLRILHGRQIKKSCPFSVCRQRGRCVSFSSYAFGYAQVNFPTKGTHSIDFWFCQ